MNKLVKLKWIDSSAPDTWTVFEEVRDVMPLIITTVGYVQNETDEFITVASHVAKYSVTGIMCIPKVCIQNTEVLQQPDVQGSDDV